jgi:hypothetical protein
MINCGKQGASIEKKRQEETQRYKSKKGKENL